MRFLVEKGHTVFMISWKNPDAGDREFGIDDYVQLGFLDALAAVRRLIPNRKVHAVGYCIGGTLLAMAAAALAARDDRSLATITLLAAQVDFSEPGELSVFITPSQIAMLEAMMSKSGVLESERMSAAFALLAPGKAQFALIVAGAVMMTGSIGPVAAVVVDVVHPGVRATGFSAAGSARLRRRAEQAERSGGTVSARGVRRGRRSAAPGAGAALPVQSRRSPN